MTTATARRAQGRDGWARALVALAGLNAAAYLLTRRWLLLTLLLLGYLLGAWANLPLAQRSGCAILLPAAVGLLHPGREGFAPSAAPAGASDPASASASAPGPGRASDAARRPAGDGPTPPGGQREAVDRRARADPRYAAVVDGLAEGQPREELRRRAHRAPDGGAGGGVFTQSRSRPGPSAAVDAHPRRATFRASVPDVNNPDLRDAPDDPAAPAPAGDLLSGAGSGAGGRRKSARASTGGGGGGGRAGASEAFGPRLDYASTLEQSYQNLEEMLGSDSIQRLTSDTRKLMQQQQSLFQAMHQMVPMLEGAKTMLDKFDVSGLLSRTQASA